MTTNFVNYPQILIDFRNALAGATLINGLAFKQVIKNAQDMDFEFTNMPMADCRIKQVIPLNTAQNTYYSTVVIEVEIDCFDMTSRDVCATMRDGLANAVQRFFQTNPHFSAFVDTVEIGPGTFETMETTTQGQWVAAAVLEFYVKLYSET